MVSCGRTDKPLPKLIVTQFPGIDMPKWVINVGAQTGILCHNRLNNVAVEDSMCRQEIVSHGIE